MHHTALKLCSFERCICWIPCRPYQRNQRYDRQSKFEAVGYATRELRTSDCGMSDQGEEEASSPESSSHFPHCNLPCKPILVTLCALNFALDWLACTEEAIQRTGASHVVPSLNLFFDRRCTIGAYWRIPGFYRAPVLGKRLRTLFIFRIFRGWQVARQKVCEQRLVHSAGMTEETTAIHSW